MTDPTNIDQQIGTLLADVKTLTAETERARARDEKIFAALEGLRLGQERTIALHEKVAAEQVEIVGRLDKHEVTLDDYKTMKTRGMAVAFGVSAIAGVVGWWSEHVVKWVKG